VVDNPIEKITRKHSEQRDLTIDSKPKSAVFSLNQSASFGPLSHPLPQIFPLSVISSNNAHIRPITSFLQVNQPSIILSPSSPKHPVSRRRPFISQLSHIPNPDRPSLSQPLDLNSATIQSFHFCPLTETAFKSTSLSTSPPGSRTSTTTFPNGRSRDRFGQRH
jgi:hypothetical protein